MRTLSSTIGLISLGFALVTGGCAAGATGAGASVNEVNGAKGMELADLALDAATGTLSFHYGIGGGCASHTAKTSVELVEASEGLVAKVNVVDVASAPDFCEAFLHIAGTANLRALISTEATRRGLDVANRSVAIDLPFARTSVEAREGRAAEASGVRRETSGLTHLALDAAGQLSFAYTTGGGCADHRGEATVELASGTSGVVAKVRVHDVSSAPDMCEALLFIEGKADLHALIVEAAKASGAQVEGRSLTIELPRASLSLR